MKYFLLILLFFFKSFIYSQNEKMSYYFDNLTITSIKHYSNNFYGKMICFSNTKDSTYVLNIYDTIKKATLDDHKKKIIINFDVNFDYNKIDDLKKLNNSELYTEVVNHKKNKYKNVYDVFEYEKDTINNQVLVHLTQFKNSKKKKIINEHYYYFSNKENIVSSNKNNIKNYILKKYNLLDIEHLNLEKIICLKEGKIDSETIYQEIKKIDYNFSFNIDEIFPKRIMN